MVAFFKLLFYKVYKGIKKYSEGDEEHCAFNAMLFTTLFLFFNLIVLFFITLIVFNIGIDDSVLSTGTLFLLLIIFVVSYLWIYRSGRYINNNKEIEKSKYKGSRGNWIIGTYICLTFISMILLAVYFLFTQSSA